MVGALKALFLMCLYVALYLAWSTLFIGSIKADMGNLSSFKPTPDQNAHWVQVTGVPFDPVESSYVLLEKDLLCPECSTAVKARESICSVLLNRNFNVL